jgi:transposase
MLLHKMSSWQSRYVAEFLPKYSPDLNPNRDAVMQAQGGIYGR